MQHLSQEFIQNHLSDSAIIYQRGKAIYEHGSFVLKESDPENGFFQYQVDGNYGDYTTQVRIGPEGVHTECDCPYPGQGCKHAVAATLDAMDILQQWKQAFGAGDVPVDEAEEPFLTPEEIRWQALEDRKKRAKNEVFAVTRGEMIKGEHLLETQDGRQYTVTLHDPAAGSGHCTCPDFLTNRLGTCKHLIFLTRHFKGKSGGKKRAAAERFPFVDVFWDSVIDRPRVFCEAPAADDPEIRSILADHFDETGGFTGGGLSDFMPVLTRLDSSKRVRVSGAVLQRVQHTLMADQMEALARSEAIPSPELKTRLYPYQEEGVRFGLYKSAVLIGDEMGLGKTLQAIALALLKKRVFGFSKVLVVTLASLKEQWKREIERFSDEKAVVVAGSAAQRQSLYLKEPSLFKVTNYEAVLRDVIVLGRFKPDLVILDEAQRIKNFSTKTADTVKRLPRKHALVLTGTPLENKLEDVYSIVQFLDPHRLSPLWRFAADHFMLSRRKPGKILGYRNLDRLHERLKPLVIRRRKEEVLEDLPREIVNTYFIELHHKQAEIHSGYMQGLLPLLNKKFLTPMDLRRIQELLLRMRMVCNSTYLIDRNTHISPKLDELRNIVDELVVQNNRKMVIFSEWTTMTYLIARLLSEAGIAFVELSGKVPVPKRQALIDAFTLKPECRVFLSTDAGGTGLNLQAADCVVNFELPWNPARINQRIGRVNRIGQKSGCVNVVNLVAKNSIEEKIMAGLQLKTDLFKGVFDGGVDMVEFSQEKRTELLNRLREMMGEEPMLPPQEQNPSADIPEDTPHFLNPEVLKAAEAQVDYAAEENPVAADASDDPAADAEGTDPVGAGSFLDGQPPERIEAVLDSGMQFIGGLLEMATGRKLQPAGDDARMVRIDRSTGEVTLKFRLPGF